MAKKSAPAATQLEEKQQHAERCQRVQQDVHGVQRAAAGAEEALVELQRQHRQRVVVAHHRRRCDRRQRRRRRSQVDLVVPVGDAGAGEGSERDGDRCDEDDRGDEEPALHRSAG